MKNSEKKIWTIADRIYLILATIIAIPEIIKYIKNIKTMALFNIIWDNITLILFLIGTICIVIIIVRRFIMIKYNQKSNQSEVDELGKFIKQLVTVLNHNIQLTDEITRDIANSDDINQLKNKFKGNKYIFDKIENYEPNNSQ